MRRWLVRIGLAVVVLFLLAQVVPFGRNHKNPAVAAEPRWDSPRTRELAKQACFDCHSNLTTWPWYSKVAPVSWLVYNDVKGGRGELNFSEWGGGGQDGAGDAVEALASGSMPPWYYEVLHPKARLSAAEKAELERGLRATLARSP